MILKFLIILNSTDIYESKNIQERFYMYKKIKLDFGIISTTFVLIRLLKIALRMISLQINLNKTLFHIFKNV